MRLFAGDVGGTNSRMAVFEARGEALEEIWSRTYPSKGHSSLVDVVRAAAGEAGVAIETGAVVAPAQPRVTLESTPGAALPARAPTNRIAPMFDAASFGVAGPVRDGVCRATNLPWVVDARELARELGLPAAGLINDLEANAYGLPALTEKDLLTLQSGDRNARGNAALVSAGTGLGEAGLYWDGREQHPFACEGGHATFSPRIVDGDETEVELLRWLTLRYPAHVSWERLVSGPGLVNIYQFLRDTGRASEPPELAQRIASGDPGREITQSAMKGECDLAVGALTLLVKLYGAEAGNCALKIMATGGVYLGGGIAPKIASWLARPIFIEAFLGKGRLRPVLEAMPVHVVLNDRTALVGAARHAIAVATPVR